jgi:hypothetical protein
VTTHPLTLVHTGAASLCERPDWLVIVSHKFQVRRRRMRRNRYLAILGRKQKSYPWFETMMQAKWVN